MKSDADVGSTLRASHRARRPAKAFAASGDVDKVATGFGCRAEREHATAVARQRTTAKAKRRTGRRSVEQATGNRRQATGNANRRQETGDRQQAMREASESAYDARVR